MPEEVLLILYLIILITQIFFLVWCARHRQIKGWVILYVFEIVSVVAAFLLMTHYNNLPGYGIMPGLSYFVESLLSMFAHWAYLAMLVITLIVNAIFPGNRKRN